LAIMLAHWPRNVETKVLFRRHDKLHCTHLALQCPRWPRPLWKILPLVDGGGALMYNQGLGRISEHRQLHLSKFWEKRRCYTGCPYGQGFEKSRCYTGWFSNTQILRIPAQSDVLNMWLTAVIRYRQRGRLAWTQAPPASGMWTRCRGMLWLTSLRPPPSCRLGCQ
jgi:hypothetical protein